MDTRTLTITQANQDLTDKKYSAVDLAKAYLKNIENDQTGAYLEVFDDVLEQAQKADERIQKGDTTPLCGIPLGIKDNILIHNRQASAGSEMLKEYRATYDATVIRKLKEEGSIFLGRTNMDEFAMGSSTENSAFGVVKNPHDLARVPGGSSGGSAAAVSGDVALAALGSDTGGSIRQPASFCGIVGLKPTYGSVSRYGLIALGSSLDQIGPLTKTVADTRILFSTIRGNDPKDSTSLPQEKFTNTATKVKRIGVPRGLMEKGVDAGVLENFEETLKKLTEEGYEIVDITLPQAVYALPAYYIVMPAEASTNLARFDGVRYGLSVEGEGIVEGYAESRSKGFGKEVRRRILLGTHVLSAGYYDAYYTKAQALRAQLIKDFNEAFSTVDVIMTPTSPTPAFKIGEKSDPLSMYAADMFTITANLTGMPALSVPSGTVLREDTSLPVGIQLTAPHMEENRLFTVGESIEK